MHAIFTIAKALKISIDLVAHFAWNTQVLGGLSHECMSKISYFIFSTHALLIFNLSITYLVFKFLVSTFSSKNNSSLNLLFLSESAFEQIDLIFPGKNKI